MVKMTHDEILDNFDGHDENMTPFVTMGRDTRRDHMHYIYSF